LTIRFSTVRALPHCRLPTVDTVEQVYNNVYTLAMQGISQAEFDWFVDLFERMEEFLSHKNWLDIKNV
jgi:hypothetical protein